MPYYEPTQANIGAIVVTQSVGDVTVSWESTDPDGTWFQVYLDGKLAWSGREKTCELPVPPTTRRVALDILAVDVLDRNRRMTAAITARSDRARLEWESVDGAESYAIFSGDGPGDSTPNYATAIDSVGAKVLGDDPGGWGVGPFGGGGFGDGTSFLSWVSEPLAGGSWTFGVKAVDAAGVMGTASEATVAVQAPPQAPPPDAAGRRLTGTYDSVTRILTLAWLASTA